MYFTATPDGPTAVLWLQVPPLSTVLLCPSDPHTPAGRSLRPPVPSPLPRLHFVLHQARSEPLVCCSQSLILLFPPATQSNPSPVLTPNSIFNVEHA